MPTPLMFDENFRVQTDSPAENVVYNGFRFPPCHKSSAEFEPVYDDSGRILKFVRLKLYLECFIFKGVEVANASQGDIGYDSSELGYFPPGNVTTETNSLDDTFAHVRQRLMEPGQELRFIAKGIGDVIIQSNDSELYDVDNGPKPELLNCRMIGGKLVYIKWSVTTSFGNCDTTRSPYAQFPFAVQFSVTPQGLSRRTITGKLELSLSRIPDQTQPRAFISRYFDFTVYRKQIAEAFPLLRQFHRDYNFTIAQDRKNIDFTVTDTEINSDNAFGEGCYNEQVTLSTGSSLLNNGFQRWRTSLSGNIEVMAGYGKVYAYREIARLFNKYFGTYATRGMRMFSDSTDSTEKSTADKPEKSHAILMDVSFTEEIFGRSVGFNFTWQLIVRIQDLFKASGMFYPLEDSHAERIKNWDKWVTKLTPILGDGGGYQELQFDGGDDVVISLCMPWLQEGSTQNITPPPAAPQEEKPKDEKGKEPKEIDDPRNGFLDYKTQFEVEVLHNNSVHERLREHTSPPEKIPEIPAPKANDFDPSLDSLRNLSPADALLEVSVHARRPPTYVLHFKGYAERVNYPPTAPKVESYGGRPVIPVGVADLRPMKLATGIDPKTGKSYQIFSLMWHKTYVLRGAPNGATIKTDGHKNYYV
jgi:hypothetical protein